MTGPRPLHRLFGLTWSDLFEGTSVSVDLELDLSRRPQFLDLVLIRTGVGPDSAPLGLSREEQRGLGGTAA